MCVCEREREREDLNTFVYTLMRASHFCGPLSQLQEMKRLERKPAAVCLHAINPLMLGFAPNAGGGGGYTELGALHMRGGQQPADIGNDTGVFFFKAYYTSFLCRTSSTAVTLSRAILVTFSEPRRERHTQPKEKERKARGGGQVNSVFCRRRRRGELFKKCTFPFTTHVHCRLAALVRPSTNKTTLLPSHPKKA